METVQSDGKGRRSAFEVDLLGLPVVRDFTRAWRSLIFANRSVRREAKALLFGELAEGAKRGVPLHVALGLSSKMVEEKKTTHWETKGEKGRYGLLSFVYFALLFVITQFGVMVYTILSFRFADVERVARLLALRLLRHVEEGLSLAVAMERCGPDYDPAEIAMIRAGVQWGRVPEALKRLAEFQTVENKLTIQGAQMLYPFFLAVLLLVPVAFVVTRIVPKFVEIFSQLGAELPGATQAMIHTLYLLTSSPLGYLFILFMGGFFGFVVVRALMNGNAISKWVFFLLGASTAIGGGMGLVVALFKVMGGNEFGEEGWSSLGVIGVGIVVIVLTPWILVLLEQVVLGVERTLGSALRYVPFFLTPARAEAEARWLGGLALALECGVSEPDAVRSAGDICGGGLRSRSHDAARLVEAGHGIGQACMKEQVLSDGMNNRLVLIGLSDTVTKGLHAAADDAAQNAYECINRSGRIAEVVALVAVGLVLAAFVLSIYLAMFSIPMVVGR